MKQPELVAEHSRQVRNRVRVGLCCVAIGVVSGFVFSPESAAFWALIALACFTYAAGFIYNASTAPKCPNCSNSLSLNYCAIGVATQRCGHCGAKVIEDVI